MKISVNNCQYFVNKKKKTVTCKMSYVLKMEEVTSNAFRFLLGEYPYCNQEVITTAYLAKGDTFDVKKGKQVARAKAETMAYKNMLHLMPRLLSKFSEMSIEVNNFINKATDTVEHNKEYLKSF